MHIIHIASECAPVAKIGGLGDVTMGLSRELLSKGHQVEVILPKYDTLDTEHVAHLQVEDDSLSTLWEGERYPLIAWSGEVEGVAVTFLETELPQHFFQRGAIYGCHDDRLRFLHFSRAALDYLAQKRTWPDILHLHDWQTGAVAPLFQEVFAPYTAPNTKVVYTIHNLAYQGGGNPSDTEKVGLSPRNNLMKEGITHADFLTTVSPTYAKEILSPEGGKNLTPLLRDHQAKFRGILNGIDYTYWNPEIDRYLSTHYSARVTPQNKYDRETLDNKHFLKKMLCEKYDLSPGPRPLVGCVARLVPQKGPELIKHAIARTVEKGGQFILLGSTTIDEINRDFHALQQHYAACPHVHLILTSQEEAVHQIFAGSDLFIVPSIFEPCGLTQLIALRYGTIPVVRRTGGLSDTVFDVDHSDVPLADRNGFTFGAPTPEGLNSALDRALSTWFDDQERWRQLMVNGMRHDYSWDRSAQSYLDLYHSLHAA